MDAAVCAGRTALNFTMAKVALVYAGEGAGQRSVASATESLIDALNIQVDFQLQEGYHFQLH